MWTTPLYKQNNTHKFRLYKYLFSVVLHFVKFYNKNIEKQKIFELSDNLLLPVFFFIKIYSMKAERGSVIRTIFELQKIIK